MHDVFSSLVGDDNASPYFAVNDERVVFRHKFSPTEAGYFEDSVVLSSTQGGKTNCRIQPLAGRTAPGLCVYVNGDQALSLGHTWVQLLPVSGTFAGADFLAYGHYPLIFWLGPGEVQNEAFNDWDARICFRLTDAQFTQAKMRVDEQVNDVNLYSVWGDNCQDFAFAVAESGGIGIFDSNFLSIPERNFPRSFLSKLSEIGHGNSFGPFAVVEINEDRRARNEYSTIPVLLDAEETSSSYSFTVNGVEHPALDVHISIPSPRSSERSSPIPVTGEIFLPALTKPAWLAANIGMPLHEIVMPDIFAQPNETVTVRTADNPGSAVHWGEIPIEEIEWGDVELPNRLSTGRHTHSYEKTGTYPLAVATFANARLYVFRWNVVVGGGVNRTKQGIPLVVIPMPDDPPSGWKNGPFTPPISPIHPDDVFFDGFETGDTSRWN